MDTEISSRSFPSIWKTFERTIEGKVRKCWIQDLTEDQSELAVYYLINYFLRDEPLAQALKLTDCNESLDELNELWSNIISQKCSLACFTQLDNMENKLIALNLCTRNSFHDDKPYIRTEKNKKLFALFDHISNLGNIYQTFAVDEYLGTMGLLTLPDYRGHNLGLELLNARKYLCKDLGLKLSVSVFTGPASQRLAEKVGFKDVTSISFDEMEKENPFLIVPNLREFSRRFRLMYIMYEP